jgi:uncharacterized protein
VEPLTVARDSSEFQVFAKPIGPLCNLECRYCYYLRKRDLYPKGESFRMAEDLLEEYIVQQIRTSAEGPIMFAWHGGEPTLLGLDYFRRIVELQRKHQPAGRRIGNGIQTNGILLDEEWCEFLAVHGFHVGLSLDGPAELHDGYRIAKGEKPTHRKVMQAYKLLRRRRVLCDLLCVVHAQNVRQPLRVYRFFKEIKAQYLGLLPLVERQPEAEGGVSDRSVPAEALGEFLCTIFDEWVRQDIGRITLQMFEEVITACAGRGHSLCIFRKTCGDVPVVEHNGDFFSCDHFVDPEHRLGNIRETALAELLESPAQRTFGEAKWDTLPRSCRACEVRFLCHGGCPKDRFLDTLDGEPGLNYLCAGFKRFFTYSRPYASTLIALRRSGASPELMMQAVRAADAQALPKTGRNEPCPCGSGKKYKHCCLGKPAGSP